MRLDSARNQFGDGRDIRIVRNDGNLNRCVFFPNAKAFNKLDALCRNKTIITIPLAKHIVKYSMNMEDCSAASHSVDFRMY
ncbi:hypothetical protein D3C71_1952320 [compost metagenome]